MKRTEMSFIEGFTSTRADNDNDHMSFDWDKAATEIKKYVDRNDLRAEAGLQRDWNHTAGDIFVNGKPTNDSYTYLRSNWATPTLIISFDGSEQIEMGCFTIDKNSRFTESSKWDETSLNILGIQL